MLIWTFNILGGCNSWETQRGRSGLDVSQLRWFSHCIHNWSLDTPKDDPMNLIMNWNKTNQSPRDLGAKGKNAETHLSVIGRLSAFIWHPAPWTLIFSSKTWGSSPWSPSPSPPPSPWSSSMMHHLSPLFEFHPNSLASLDENACHQNLQMSPSKIFNWFSRLKSCWWYPRPSNYK